MTEAELLSLVRQCDPVGERCFDAIKVEEFKGETHTFEDQIFIETGFSGLGDGEWAQDGVVLFDVYELSRIEADEDGQLVLEGVNLDLLDLIHLLDVAPVAPVVFSGGWNDDPLSLERVG